MERLDDYSCLLLKRRFFKPFNFSLVSQHKGQKYNAAVKVEAVEDRYGLLVDAHNNVIRESAEYRNFKDPKSADVQARATAVLNRREELKKLETELCKDEKAIREDAGLSRWFDTEDFSKVGDHMDRVAREKHFEGRFKNRWISDSRLRDAIRAHNLMSVDELATLLITDGDLKKIEESLPGTVDDSDDVDA